MSKKQCRECKRKPADKTCQLGFCLDCRREFFKREALKVVDSEWF